MYKGVYRALFIVAPNWKKDHIVSNSLSSTFTYTSVPCSFLNAFYAFLYFIENILCSKICKALHAWPCSAPQPTLPAHSPVLDMFSYGHHGLYLLTFAHSSPCLDILPPVHSILFICMEISNFSFQAQIRYYLLPEACFKIHITTRVI